MDSENFDKDKMKITVLKLLDKAGNDPRLTSRILRNKVEDKMNLARGTLKVKKEYIKTLILKWWKINHKSDNTSSSKENKNDTTYKALLRVATAAQKIPHILKNMDKYNEADKVSILRKRLRDANLVFSDIPTNDEIEKIKKETEKKKDLEGLNQSNILSPSKKRKMEIDHSNTNTISHGGIHKESKINKDGSSNNTTNHSTTNSSSSSSSTAHTGKGDTNMTSIVNKPKKVIQYNSSDEEGDF